MIGYHHVLMIIIAIAIILLCKFRSTLILELHVGHWNVTNDDSSPFGWMFLVIPPDPRYLSHLDVL